jgi:hypothetical protein
MSYGLVKPGYVHGKPHTFGGIIHINDMVTSILWVLELQRLTYKTNIIYIVQLNWINVRENRRDNQEWTIQKSWQHWANETSEQSVTSLMQKQNKYTYACTTKCWLSNSGNNQFCRRTILYNYCRFGYVWFMVFNATFNNISVINEVTDCVRFAM